MNYKYVIYPWIFLSLLGCGSKDIFIYQCDIEGLGEYKLEYQIDCDMIQAEVDLAMDVLNIHNLVPKNKQDVFSYVEINVYKTQCLDPNDPQYCGGEYFVFPHSYINLNYRRRSLLHELLHHWDAVHLVINTGYHTGWDTNGYNNASIEFKARLQREIWTERWRYNPDWSLNDIDY